ncbi:hypothetical protein TELCIR_08542 [Teladorsagia circumcincta]|uniref:Uncharacterized protein n=1 Tax=Teladorsagia circumcincta TaxID=45464 RepID=A0A2G9UHK6_TELCI|nr:hypothetical protein TELCIR_08542 [Teladorsagia circumcincta]
MTTSGQSKLPSPLTDQSTPFRVPLKKSLSSVDGAQTTTTGEAPAESSEPSPSPLSSTDTWYGLPSLIETVERSELEAFARPGPDDEKWVAQTHDYFDNEKVYVRKPSKPTVGRRLRIGRLQRKRWSSIMREVCNKFELLALQVVANPKLSTGYMRHPIVGAMRSEAQSTITRCSVFRSVRRSCVVNGSP